MPMIRRRNWFCMVGDLGMAQGDEGIGLSASVDVEPSKRGRRKDGNRAGNGWLDFDVVFFAGSNAT